MKIARHANFFLLCLLRTQAGVSEEGDNGAGFAAEKSSLRRNLNHNERSKSTLVTQSSGGSGSSFVSQTSSGQGASWCQYTCPEFSVMIPNLGRECPWSFYDCQCEDGYFKSAERTCRKWCNYKCPANSYRIPGQDCYDNFSDCRCIDGFVKNGDVCTKTCIQCPDNSTPNTDCVLSFWRDCDCDSGYYPKDGKCVEWCYECPKKSYPKNDCPKSFDDCICEDDFEKSGNNCRRKKCDYSCPANSSPKSNCPRSFWKDCQCDNGYVPSSDQTCEEWCGYDCYSRRAYRNPHVDCHTTFDHCVCWKGYQKDTVENRCYKN